MGPVHRPGWKLSDLLFHEAGRIGRDDIYIAFKGKDGQWGPPKNMGEEVNSPGSENRPYVTRDGKYFFFTSTRNGSRDTFWVQAEYLDRFRNTRDVASLLTSSRGSVLVSDAGVF